MIPVRIKRGWVPGGKAAWVPKPRTIVLAEGVEPSVKLIAHELCHVQQYERLGYFFYLSYVIGWASAGFSYANNWMEREAVDCAKRYKMQSWARDLLEARRGKG